MSSIQQKFLVIIITLVVSTCHLYAQEPDSIKQVTTTIKPNGDSVITTRITTFEKIPAPSKNLTINGLTFLFIPNFSYHIGVTDRLSLGLSMEYSDLLETDFFTTRLESRFFLSTENSLEGLYIASHIGIRIPEDKADYTTKEYIGVLQDNIVTAKTLIGLNLSIGSQHYTEDRYIFGYDIGLSAWIAPEKTMLLPSARFNLGLGW